MKSEAIVRGTVIACRLMTIRRNGESKSRKMKDASGVEKNDDGEDEERRKTRKTFSVGIGRNSQMEKGRSRVSRPRSMFSLDM